jgi:hypothetical protein
MDNPQTPNGDTFLRYLDNNSLWPHPPTYPEVGFLLQIPSIFAPKGSLHFLNDKSVPLIEDSQSVSGCYYRVHEDLTIPDNSMMHTVELKLALDAPKGQQTW